LKIALYVPESLENSQKIMPQPGRKPAFSGFFDFVAPYP